MRQVDVDVVSELRRMRASLALLESSLDDLVETIENPARAEVPTPSDERPELTPRELEILRLMAEGLANKEIALRLALRPGTVKNHVHSVLAKLEAGSRTEAVARASGGGLHLV